MHPLLNRVFLKSGTKNTIVFGIHAIVPLQVLATGDVFEL
jgi:hypothetical protein